jgi:hypothetical protein
MKFVIHRHHTVPDHYDLMFEDGDRLATFRLEAKDMAPLLAGDAVILERIHDHDRRYLSYEGPISCDRGRIELFDRGSCRKDGGDWSSCTVHFSGEVIAGAFSFLRNTGEKSLTMVRLP